MPDICNPVHILDLVISSNCCFIIHISTYLPLPRPISSPSPLSLLSLPLFPSRPLPHQSSTSRTGRSGQVGSAQVSSAEVAEFESQLSQTNDN